MPPKTESLIPLVEWAEQNRVKLVTARKYAQNGRLIGAQKIFVGRNRKQPQWVVPITAKVPPPGESGNPNFKRGAINQKHVGSSFDDFLKEEGTFEQTEAAAQKRVADFQSRK